MVLMSIGSGDELGCGFKEDGEIEKWKYIQKTWPPVHPFEDLLGGSPEEMVFFCAFRCAFCPQALLVQPRGLLLRKNR